MAKDQLGFRQTYKQSGSYSASDAGDTRTTDIDKGPGGSHRDNNWKIGAAQGKMAKPSKVGPAKNLKDINGGNFY
jgi:hypothetical protein